MFESGFQDQLRWFLEALTSGEGIIGCALFVLLLIGLLITPRVKWGVLGLMLWMSTTSFFLGVRVIPLPLAQPLNSLRSFGRPITVALLASLLIPTITSSRGWRQRILGGGILALFFFEMMIAVRTTAGGVATRGALSMMLYPLIFVVLGWGVSR
jgi:hypothetical protein